MNSREAIVVASSDVERLHMLINSSESSRRHDQERLRVLNDELAAAEVIEDSEMPMSVVALNSYVDFTDLGTGRRHKYQVVFPPEADLSRNRVSVLAPIGIAMLGRRVGTEIECPILRGVRRFRIEQVRHGTSSEEQAAAKNSRRPLRLEVLVLLMGALRRWYWQLTQRKGFHLNSGWSN